MTGELDGARREQVVVAGIGNEYRRDDGVGVAVAARVARLAPWVRDIGPVVDPLDLLGRWDEARLAVVIDALQSQDRAGTVRVIELASSSVPVVAAGDGHVTSSHGVDVTGALRIARAVERAPGRVVLVGVVGADFSHGRGLSADVEVALPGAAQAVLELIGEERVCA